MEKMATLRSFVENRGGSFKLEGNIWVSLPANVPNSYNRFCMGASNDLSNLLQLAGITLTPAEFEFVLQGSRHSILPRKQQNTIQKLLGLIQ